MSIQRAIVVFDPTTVIEGRLRQEIDTLTEQSFRIVRQAQLQLNEEQINKLAGCNNDIKTTYSSGPVAALIVEHENVVNELENIALENAFFTTDEYTTSRAMKAIFSTPCEFERTILIIYPMSNSSPVEKILSEMCKVQGIVEVHKEERVLTNEEAKAVVSNTLTPNITDNDEESHNSQNEDKNSEELVQRLSESSSSVILLDGIDAVHKLMMMIGPNNNASQMAPESIRAQLELQQILAEFAAPTTSNNAELILEKLYPKGLSIQRTLALIKPDAIGARNDIIKVIEKNGFTIVTQKLLSMSITRAECFYAEHKDKAFFADLVDFMTSGPIVALVLSKAAAILSWRTLLGPTNSIIAKKEAPYSIRAQFGTDGRRNACHGSDSVLSSRREIHFFFEHLSRQELPTTERIRQLLLDKEDVREGSTESSLNQVLIRALTHLCKHKPVGNDAIRELGVWLRDNNPNQPVIEYAMPASVPAKTTVQQLVMDNHVDKLKVVFVLGGPGSGKGTQCAKLVSDLNFHHISSGDCLRSAMKSGDSPEGEMISECVASGKLVPDSVVLNLLEKEMAKSGAYKFLIDGYPRRIDQAFAFEKQICACDCVLFLDVPDSTMRSRLIERGKSSGRSDDNSATIIKRLRTFHDESMPAIEHYGRFGKLHTIAANRCIQDVFADVCKALK